MGDLMFPKPDKAKKKYPNSESIMQEDKTRCFLCGKPARYNDPLEEHHIFEGTSNRRMSEKYGLKIYLHGISCHREGIRSVHKNKVTDILMKQKAQARFEENHSREEFIRIFGRNYLED